jgi:hypothetical protein
MRTINCRILFSPTPLLNKLGFPPLFNEERCSGGESEFHNKLYDIILFSTLK